MSNWDWIPLDRVVTGEKLTPVLNERMSRLRGIVNEKQRKLVVDIRDFGNVGGGNHDNTSELTKAITQAAGYLPLRVVPGTYPVSSGISLPDDTHLQLDHAAVIQMTTRLGNAFTATSKSNIHISGRGSIRGTNTSHADAFVERLFYFIGCSDLSVTGVELAESNLGCHLESCTDWDFDCRVRDILHDTDFTAGYGILTTLSSTRFRIGGRFKNIGRHAIYCSSGVSLGTIDDVVVDGCDASAISFYSFGTEATTHDITVGDNVTIYNVGRGSGSTSEPNGITISEDCEGITIGNVLIDTFEHAGIRLNGTSTRDPDHNPRNITIGSPLIRNSTGTSYGIRMENCSKVTLVKPRFHGLSAFAIYCSISGSSTGSFTDDVDIGSYDINGAVTGITVSGATATTNVSIGWGHMRNVSGSKFNIPTTVTGSRYVGPSRVFGFTETDLAASQTDNQFVANPVAAYWATGEAGYITELFGTMVGATSAGTLTIAFMRNGVASTTLKTSIGVGQSAFSAKVPIGTIAMNAGDLMYVSYTSDGSLSPLTRDVVASVIFCPFPSAT